MTDSANKPILQTITIETPAMYADHHVVEVRRILSEISGVEDIYASSAFKVVEVSFDPAKTSEASITDCLQKSGYLGELQIPVEMETSAKADGDRKPFFRRTAMYEQTRQAVSFSQVVIYSGRPLWQCPGMGVIGKKMEE
jgi:copper chaperone CopZ